MSKFFPLSMGLRTSRVAGVGIGLSVSHFLMRRIKIANETAVDPIVYTNNIQNRPLTIRRSRFDGRLNYQHLSIGSFSGLLVGYIVGKISKLLVFLTATGLLGIQFLESRGIIQTSNIPLVQRIYGWGRDHLNIKEFMLDKPSFKFSFFSSFLIAAFYA